MTAINEIHGRDAGDRCLKGVACLLREAVRDTTWSRAWAATSSHLASRYRRPWCDPRPGAHSPADYRCQWPLGSALGLSMGSAHHHRRGTSGSSLLRCAEVSMQLRPRAPRGLNLVDRVGSRRAPPAGLRYPPPTLPPRALSRAPSSLRRGPSREGSHVNRGLSDMTRAAPVSAARHPHPIVEVLSRQSGGSPVA